MTKKGKTKALIPERIKLLPKPPAPDNYSVYDKLKELCGMRRNKSITSITDLSFYIRGNKDGLRMSEYGNSFSYKEIHILAKVFNIPVEWFSSPMSATDYLLSIANQGDTVNLLDQITQLKELVKMKDQVLESKNNEIKKMKNTIKLHNQDSN